jgi:hypothetical protein
MTTHKPHPIEVRLHRIQEALERKPDHGDVEDWASDLAFKLEEIHEDVRDLQGELTEMKGQLEDLQSEDR